MSGQPFSVRTGYVQLKAITYRDELPPNLRLPIVRILLTYMSSQSLREALELLFNPYGTDDWPKSTVPVALPTVEDMDENVRRAKAFLLNGPWYRIYDVIEDVFNRLHFYDTELKSDPEEEERTSRFQQEINNYFEHDGIGWRVDDRGKVVARGEAAFEIAVNTAAKVLQEARKATAARQINEALQALSRRPEPNFRGAVFHAMGAVECIARDLAGDQKPTLGEVLRQHPGLLPRPLDEALSKLWGYASNEARHVEQGREPGGEEAELIVGLAAALCTYLARKGPDTK